MVQNKPVGFGKVVRSIQGGNIDPVYFLEGNDGFLEQFFIRELEQALFAENPPNKTLLLSDEMSGKEIMDRLTASDLFSSNQLFILRQPVMLKGKTADELIEYVKHPINDNCLVLVVEEWGNKSGMVKKLKKALAPVSITTPQEYRLDKWVKFLFKEEGFESISPEVVSVVLGISGDSLSHISNEIQKICISVPDGQKITVEDVYTYSGAKRGHQTWKFLTAVGERDLPNAVKKGQSLISRETSMNALVFPLTCLFQEILFLKMTSGTSVGPNGYINLSRSVVRKLPKFAQCYRRHEVERNLRILAKIDEELKTTHVSNEYALTRFLFDGLSKDG